MFKKLFCRLSTALALLGSAFSLQAQTLTEVLLPQYTEGLDGTNNDRVPLACRLTLSGLSANATYRYFNQVVVAADGPTVSGAGNMIFVAADGTFTRTSSPALGTAGNYGEFTTDGSGAYTGWFILEPSGNTRFASGNDIFIRIMLNDGAGGSSVATRLTTTNSIKVLTFGAGATDGTGIRGNSSFAAKSFVFLYDNTAGTGRPLAGTLVESDGIDLPDANYVDFHDTLVDGNGGAWGTIVPNTLANGVRRVENRVRTTGAVATADTDADGVWGSTNTVNPTGGKTTILTLGTGDNPNISAPATLFISARANTTGTAQLIISNNGPSAALNITGATFSGANAARFSVQTPLPSFNANTTGPLVVRYNPASLARTSATLNITSNDQSGDVISVVVTGQAADTRAYRGLIITEVASAPSEDEFVEIQNTTRTAVNIGGVILSDEDNNNTEGAIAFPAGTTIAVGEVIIVAVGNSATVPSWLASVGSGKRVFVEPARDKTAWSAPSGVTLIAMDDYVAASGGTGSSIQLSSGDGVAIYAPNTPFFTNAGPFPTTATIDGMNYNQGDTGPLNPINSDGGTDTVATRAGVGEPPAGSSLNRLNINPNTNSFTWFALDVITPGLSNLPLTPVNAARHWDLY